MSTKSNVYSQGGGGTAYEFEVQTAFMILFLTSGTVPGIADAPIESIRFQSGSLGYETDDMLIECIDANGTKYKCLFQVKHQLTISEKNSLFNDVLEKCWKDYNNSSLFNSRTDKIYIVKSNLTLDEKRHLKTICNWARVKDTPQDFINEVERIVAKKSYLDMFRNILKTKTTCSPTDEEMFRFFSCIDLLEYDFGEASSTSKTHFLALIQQGKQPGSALSAEQVWNDVFTFVSHTDNKGGSFSNANRSASLDLLFKNDYYPGIRQSLIKLCKQSFESIENLKDSIGSTVLERPDYLDQIVTSTLQESITIITGEPGSGKSVLAKQYIGQLAKQQDGFILVFKADELNKINFRDYFLRYNIQLTIGEIFSLFPLGRNNYIYIDSLEKLLEGDGDAFKQLQQACTPESGIRIIATCREAELSLIRIKYLQGTPTEPVKIKLLSDEELSMLQRKIPALTPILQNKRIYPLLRVPKYLDFAFMAQQQSGDDFSGSDEPQFMQQLWSIIVEKRLTGNTPGLPEKRNKQFIDLAVERARKMMPYIIPADPDFEALANLERDGVIVKSAQTDAYAPAHDILEDWALIKHVDKIFFQQKVPTAFFNLLGKEPAIRRAFRLWTLHALKTQDTAKLALLTAILKQSAMESYWQDESVIALLQSPYLSTFISLNQSLLLKNEWELFTKLIHLLRTSCREYEFISFLMAQKFVPTGDSWHTIIDFIFQHKEQLPVSKYELVVQTINDWHFILYSNEEDLTEISAKAGAIIRYLLDEHYVKQSDYYHRNNSVLLCTKLLLACTGGNPANINTLLKEASRIITDDEEDDLAEDDKTRKRYHAKIIKLVESGPDSTQVAKYLPETLIEILKKSWFYYPPAEDSDDDTPYYRRRGYHSRSDHNIPFGLTSEYKTDYFPASAYQTPVYWLLKQAPTITTEFIIELFNHSVTSFINSDYADSDERSEIELYLPDGKVVRQHGSMGLWCMFRGTGIATPYLLQSVLMAFEKYLLELCKEGMLRKELLQELLGKILSESTTVSLTAVVASVAQAYPSMTGKWTPPLFSSRKMLYWDIVRYGKDRNPTYLLQREDKRAFQRERVESDKLPHRLQNTYGLKSFIVNYCLTVREYNTEIFTILDTLRNAAKENDWEWKKILNDIDIRHWTVTHVNVKDDKTEFQIEPEHTGQLKEEVEKMKDEVKGYETTSGHTHWLLQVSEKKLQPDLQTLRDIISYYRSQQELNPQHHHPGLAAATGIRYFWNELEQEEKQWCFDTAYSIAAKMINKERTYDYLTFDTSPFDDDATMGALPLLLGADDVDSKDFAVLLANILFANVSYNSTWYNALLYSFSANAWAKEPDISLQLWKVLVKFSKLDKNNPFYLPRKPSEDIAEAYINSVEKLVNELDGDAVTTDLNDINFESCSQWVLLKVIKMIPDQDTPEPCCKLLLRLLDLLTELSQQVREHDWRDREDRIDHHIQHEMEEKLGKVILWNASSTGKELLGQVMERFYQGYARQYTDMEKKGDMIRMFRDILKNIIYAADKNLPFDDEPRLQNTITCFSSTWQELFRILVSKSTFLSGDLLLLNIGWNENARHWKPLEAMIPFYNGLILLAGSHYPEATVNLLSHIGDQTLLPGGLNSLWVSLQKNSPEIKLLSIPHIEQLVYRTYNHHLEALRADSTALVNFISLLDQLVKEGSSDAYWIREYLISFK
jgi:hypothetical protein